MMMYPADNFKYFNFFEKIISLIYIRHIVVFACMCELVRLNSILQERGAQYAFVEIVLLYLQVEYY